MYFHNNSANKVSVFIKEDSHEKNLWEKKSIQCMLTTFITSFIYMYVHGDQVQPS